MSHSREPNANSNGRRLNPMAVNFTPAGRNLPKRKASSSAKSTLSLTPSPPQRPGPPDQVCIDAEQLFDQGKLETPAPSDIAMDLEDLNELDDALLPAPARIAQELRSTFFRRQQRQDQRAVTSYRNSNATQQPQSQRPALVLIQTGPQRLQSQEESEKIVGGAPFLPLYLLGPKLGEHESNSYDVLRSTTQRIQQTCHSRTLPRTATWPANRIPVELFELIAAHLARDDIMSMRLVNKEFERAVCQSLFRTSVVPFNTELYDMIVDERNTSGRQVQPRYKGKGKKKATEKDAELWAWQNAKEDKEGKVYHGHGLRVFQGFGPFIKRFGMSFEVTEAQLQAPPGKQLLDPVDSYHGTYQWPSINYARYAKLNRLEETADETSRMKAAFSNLSIVTELGLSVRNGLGWLDGPDKSFRTKLLQRPASIFGSSYGSKDRFTKSARDLLSCLRQAVHRGAPGHNFREITLEQHTLRTPLDRISGLKNTCFANTKLWPKLPSQVAQAASYASSEYTAHAQPSSDGFKVLGANIDLMVAASLTDIDLNPSDLKKEQKEWLLETEWAQRAFLESYMLAVMDNPAVFSRVKTLKIAALSSGLIGMVSRGMFWDALPSLSNLRVLISADWRTVQKDEAAYAETTLRNPSDALRAFHHLLADQILPRDNITSLTFGWADGGENAQGMFARNSNILPAPVSQLDQSDVVVPMNQLVFKHVEHLTLSNCWITPPMLERLINNHANQALKKLTLDSVSLTCYPHPIAAGQQAQVAAAALANLPLHFHPQGQATMLPQVQQAMAQQAAAAQQFQIQWQQWQQFVNNPAHGMQFGNAGAPAPNAGPFIPGQAWNAAGPVLGNTPQQPAWAMQANLLNVPHQPPNFNTMYWMNNHRQGSWPDLLNRISPGPVFTDYLSAPQPWEPQHPARPPTNLQSMELISCGYARLDHNTTFDQTALLIGSESARERAMTPWFRARAVALRPYMLDAGRDKYLGNIVQAMPQHELDALRYAWGLREGWQNREKAEEAEFDGHLSGGTGRVSGVIEKGMPLMTQHVPSPSAMGSDGEVTMPHAE